MAIDNKTMVLLERQAALELTGTDRLELSDQMNAVLSCLDVLRDCPDTASTWEAACCPLRADEVRPSTDRTAVLANAPATDEEFFLVPRTVE